jgi:hypothetical protein
MLRPSRTMPCGSIRAETQALALCYSFSLNGDAS